MILIVEGADLVGKTTLIEEFRRTHPWPIAKIRWALVGDARAETVGMATATIELLLATAPTNIIFDRCYFSMWAYGKTYDYLPQLIANFDRVSSAVPTVCVVLTATPAELQRRYERQPDEFHSLEIIQRANQRYLSLLPLLPKSVTALHIDTATTTPEEAVAFVLDSIGD